MATTRKSVRKPRNPPRMRVRRGNVEDALTLRKALLDAAMRLFTEGGLESVSMREVAARTGVSAMTPYRYFANKAELLSGLWQFVLRSVLDEMERAVAQQASPRDRVRASLEAFLLHFEGHPSHYQLLFMIPQTTRPDDEGRLTAAPVYAELLGLVRRVLTEFAQELGVAPTHVKLAADVRAAMQVGYLHGTLVNLRYPWTERSQLRTAYVELTLGAMEQCLRYGAMVPPVAATPARAG